MREVKCDGCDEAIIGKLHRHKGKKYCTACWEEVLAIETEEV